MECGFSEMVVEGDNQMVMSALKLRKRLSSGVGHIIQDVLCLLSGFRWLQVHCIRRGANTAARALAKFAKNVPKELIWLEDSPPPVIEALYFDSSSI